MLYETSVLSGQRCWEPCSHSLRFHDWTQPLLTLLFWAAPVKATGSCLHPHFQVCSLRNQVSQVQLSFCQFHPMCNSPVETRGEEGKDFPVYTNLCGDHPFSHKPTVFSEATGFSPLPVALRSSILDCSLTRCSSRRIIICISLKLNLLKGTVWQIKLEAAGIVMRTLASCPRWFHWASAAAPGGPSHR